MRRGLSALVLILMAALCGLGAPPVTAEPLSPQAVDPSIHPQGVEYNPVLAEMIAQVDSCEIYDSTYDLQNFTTRMYPSPGNSRATSYLFDRLDAIPGLEVRYQGTYRNVIAALPGRDRASGGVIVVGAHLDSRSSDPEHAPGATDDGAGVGIVLELARVMSTYQFNRTIEFACWNSEEWWHRGSAEYVADAANDSRDLLFNLNFDTSCYDPGNEFVLDVVYNNESASFADLEPRLNSLYGIGLTLTCNGQNGTSDHVSFWDGGYPAIMTASRLPAPYTHSRYDTIDLVSPEFAKRNAQLGVALLATTAGLAAPDVGLPVTCVPGGYGTPRDADGDRKNEDVNGNGRADFADVVLYFNQMSWIAGNEQVSAFDYNGNGRIDFADVVWLFGHL